MIWQSSGALDYRLVADDGEILDEVLHRAGEYEVRSTGKRYTTSEYAKQAAKRKHGSGVRKGSGEYFDGLFYDKLNAAGVNASDQTQPLDPALREFMGKLVRHEWEKWAREQPSPKPSWLTPWDQLTEPEREVDRRIAEAIWRFSYVRDASGVNACDRCGGAGTVVSFGGGRQEPCPKCADNVQSATGIKILKRLLTALVGSSMIFRDDPDGARGAEYMSAHQAAVEATRGVKGLDTSVLDGTAEHKETR